MTQETTMQTEPMNVETKDLTPAEALQLAIAEARLSLCELGDAADEAISSPLPEAGNGWNQVERYYLKTEQALDRCKAAADGLGSYSRVLEMANRAAGDQVRRQADSLRSRIAAYAVEQDERDEIIKTHSTEICWPCLGWMAFATLLGMGMEFANGFLARASGWLL